MRLATRMRQSNGGRAVAREEVPEVYADVVTSATKPLSLGELAEERRKSPGQESRVEVKHYTAKNWGARHDNEDRVMASSDEYGPQSSQSLRFHTIGVLDGHDSSEASEAVSRELPGVLAGRLKKGGSILEAYVDTMHELEETLKNIHSTAGTCVLSCTIAGRYIWCSNLGDCRGCLVHLQPPDLDRVGPRDSCPKIKSISWMSLDQKACSPNEKKRISEAGGMVIDGRVEGLEPSRTLGDFDVKLSVKQGVISIVPEIRCVELGDGTTPAQAILVCATDGVWDVMSGQDVCSLVVARKEFIKLQASIHSGPQQSHLQCLKDLAEDLVQFSIARGSRDDCTAVVALISIQPK